jgi:glucosamine--fructose-6-phosphate aminotransferase (isomerizing)
MFLLYYGLQEKLSYGKKILKETIETGSDMIERFMDSEAMINMAGVILSNGIRFMPILGTGASYSTALEASLKIDELTEIPTRAYLSQEFKHGHLQLIQYHKPGNVYKQITSLAIIPDDDNYSVTATTLKEIRARFGLVIEITSKSKKDRSINQIIIPEVSAPETSQILASLATQILAFRIGEITCEDNPLRNIDKPNNLAKTLTVN